VREDRLGRVNSLAFPFLLYSTLLLLLYICYLTFILKPHFKQNLTYYLLNIPNSYHLTYIKYFKQIEPYYLLNIIWLLTKKKFYFK